MNKKNCLSCQNSVYGTAMDGSDVLICYECAGHKGIAMQVSDEDVCEHFKRGEP